MTDMTSSVQFSPIGSGLRFITGSRRDAELYFDKIADLYERDFVDPPLRGTYAFSKERLEKKLLEQYSTKPSFKMVTAWNDNELVGFVYGNALTSETSWWRGVNEPLPEGFIEENGNRTRALYDICVKRSFEGKG